MFRYCPGGQLLPAVIAWLACVGANASGMLPETSVVLVRVADGEGFINVLNTDAQPALLHTSLEHVAEDPAELLIAVPPVTRVEPGESQRVRFILTPGEPILTQRLKRVSFEGIPQKLPGSTSRISVSVRQNLPVIIHPTGLVLKADPWTELKWSLEHGQLRVRNDSPYVVRLRKGLQLLPGTGTAELPHNYVLPGQQLMLPVQGVALAAFKQVRLFPASLYGFQMPPYEAALRPRAEP